MDVIELTRALLRFDTTNPPHGERDCATMLASVLEEAGLAVRLHPFGPGRANLVAHHHGSDPGLKALVLTGHLDVVPLGAAAWARDPFAGEVADGRIHGRGVADMKAGVAALAIAAMRHAAGARSRRGFTLIFTGGEETGCEGALSLARQGGAALGGASALLVGEPTGSRIALGHRGCLAVKAVARGVTAHSSTPERGVNAIYAAARAALRIADLALPCGHGRVKANVGTISGGLNYNSVPDRAEFTIDVRTPPEGDHVALLQALRDTLGDAVDIEPFIDLPSVSTQPDDPFVELTQILRDRELGGLFEPPLSTMPYFSDASVLTPFFDGCPTVLLGPGDPRAAHQTDEWCGMDAIVGIVGLYTAILSHWCG